jgi:hypothetical protein
LVSAEGDHFADYVCSRYDDTDIREYWDITTIHFTDMWEYWDLRAYFLAGLNASVDFFTIGQPGNLYEMVNNDNWFVYLPDEDQFMQFRKLLDNYAIDASILEHWSHLFTEKLLKI